MYLFQFFHIMGLERVLKGSPWTFNNHLLILSHLQQEGDPLKVPLIYTHFWVQIHDMAIKVYLIFAVGVCWLVIKGWFEEGERLKE